MEFVSDYNQDFDSELYLRAYHNFESEYVNIGSKLTFVMDLLHQIFKSDIDFGHRLLDVGTGPTIWSVLSASRHLQHIDLCDYTKRNLDILRNWRDGKRSEDKAFIKYEMELAGDRRTIAEREDEIRSTIGGIFHVDVRTESVFLEARISELQYDVITTCFCLESASKFKEIYIKSLGNVTKLLKPDGHLLMFGVLEQNNYRVGNFLFPSVNLKAEEIRNTIDENGFQILKWQTFYDEDKEQNEEHNTLTDCKNIYALFAKKLE